MSELSYNIVRTDDVIGKDVMNQNKENLGVIQEIVLDKISGQARYVVLSFGGFLGLGDKYFAFPWNAIRYSTENNCFILNVDKNLLKEENGFDKDRWPDMQQWPETIDRYYNIH